MYYLYLSCLRLKAKVREKCLAQREKTFSFLMEKFKASLKFPCCGRQASLKL